MDLVVLGGGESGVGAAMLAKKKGMSVFVSDKGKIKDKHKETLARHGIAFEEGKHTENTVLTANEVVKSPGIPEKAPLVQALVEKGIRPISEIEFAGRYSKAKFIGITGSNGKTTTTLLTHYILKKAGIDAGLAGNVGKSLARHLAEGADHEWFVLELSSFQLDGMFDFKCDIGILLNITPDHLDRYGYKLENYAASKMRIVQNQTKNDWFVYCDDDPVTLEMLATHSIASQKIPFSIEHEPPGNAAWAKNDQLFINLNNNPLVMTIQELALQGKHNLYNSMAGGIASRILDIRKDLIRECLSDFQNIEHRLEHVNSVCGINFINDSKATNVNSAWYALESQTDPVIWIVGGIDKGNDYNLLKDIVREKVKAIVCLGVDNSKIHEAFADIVPEMTDCTSMRDAVLAAYRLGKKGDTVLLSPACASFDLFEDYEDRGHQFKEAVRNL